MNKQRSFVREETSTIITQPNLAYAILCNTYIEVEFDVWYFQWYVSLRKKINITFDFMF